LLKRIVSFSQNSNQSPNISPNDQHLFSKQGRRQQGGSGARPPIWNWCPPFHVWPPVATYIQYCILKMWPPLLAFGPSWFLPTLLLNTGDGPVAKAVKSTTAKFAPAT